MKKCDYCAKEISYYDQYCDEECERKALDFYSLRERYTKIFSIFNVIGVFGIPVGLFLSAIDTVIGFSLTAFSLMLVGITVFLLPFPVENMISSMKIKKAVFVTRMIGVGFIVLGIALFVLRILVFK